MNRAEPYKIHSFCTGNSARSIFGEYIIRRLGRGLFQSYSAGANPAGRVNPYARRVLKEVYHIGASDARSEGFKGLWDEPFDFVITVCDKAETDEEIYEQFRQTAMMLKRRIDL